MPKSPQGDSRRLWWAAMLLLFTTAIAGLIWWSQDEPPPDVSDFIFEPLQLTDDQNAYALITQAALLVPKRERTSDEHDTFDAMLQGEEWDDALAQTCIEDLAPAWPLLKRAIQLPKGQTPWLSALSDTMPEVAPINRLTRMIQIRAFAETREGNPDQGLRTALIPLTVGFRMEESRGAIIHYLFGSSIKRDSLAAIQRIVTHHSPSDDALHGTLRTLSASRSSKRSLALAFYSELRFFENGFGILQREGAGNLLKGMPDLLFRLAPRALLLKPNKTKKAYVEFMRASADAVDAPVIMMETMVRPDEFNQRHLRRTFAWNPENALGRIYLGIITPTTTSFLKSRLRLQSEISACEALLAIKLYQRAHGELPATLDQLVPAYLPAVPRDYFDGGSIRYSRDLGVIWSVGENNLNITEPHQVIEQREVVLYLIPRP